MMMARSMKQITLDASYVAGRKAHYKGKSRNESPDYGEDDYGKMITEAWLRGWDEDHHEWVLWGER